MLEIGFKFYERKKKHLRQKDERFDERTTFLLSAGLGPTMNPKTLADGIRKFEKNDIIYLFNSKYKIGKNLCPKISFRTSNPSFG